MPDEPARPRLEIRLLGDVTVLTSRAGSDAELRGYLGSAQVRVAVAVLTLEREHGVTRDTLADAMWPDGLPPTWASALRTVVSRVRALMTSALGGDGDGEDPIVARGGAYRLRIPDDTVVDIEEAESQIVAAQQALTEHRFDQALALATDGTDRLRAPFLPDHDGGWVTRRRAHLTELLVVGLEIVGQAAGGLGRGSVAVSAALEAVDHAPLRESAHRCLMAAHATAGNRAEALHAYQRLRHMLADELGVEPDAETEAAYLRLLGPPPTPARPEDERPAPAWQAPAPFVGRRDELAVAFDAWSRALAAVPQLMLVSGEAGIGKTRFAMEFAQRVTSDGALVLFGRCDQEAIIPYQAVIELLDALVAATPDDELPRLSGPARTELAAVFPSFAGAHGAGEPRRPVDRSMLFDAVTRVIRRVATDRPLLVVLDDLQWADGDTSLLVQHLLRHIGGIRLLVIAIARDDGATRHRLDAIIGALDPGIHLRRVRLGGIDHAACKDLVRRIAPDADQLLAGTAKLVADTSGNPFMLLELLRAATDGGSTGSGPGPAGPAAQVPSALDDLVETRLTTLAPAARDLLQAAAVTGGHFDLAIAGAAAGLDRTATLEALDLALASHIVVEVGSDDASDRYRFAHDIVRRTLYARLSRARRRYLHERVADAIEDHAGRPAEVSQVPTLAYHRCAGAESGGDVRAVRWALVAAAQAEARGAPAEAQRWCREALGHVTQGDMALEAEVLTELGLAQIQEGDATGEPTLLGAALRARRCGRVDVAARAALGLANLARRQPGLVEEASALIHDVLIDDPPGAARGARLPRVLWAQLVARRVELGRSATDAEPTQVATAVTVLTRALGDLGGPDRIDERLALADDLRVIASATDDLPTQLLAHHHRASAAAIAGDEAAAEEALRSMALAEGASRDPVAQTLLEERALNLAVTRGRFEEAEAKPFAADEPTTVAAVHPAPGAMATRQMWLARWLQGRTGEEAVDELAPELADSDPAGRALWALGQGDRGAARLAVRALVAGDEPLPSGDEWLHSVGLLGLAAAELGDPVIATDLCVVLAPHVTLSCGVGYRSFVGTATFHLGRLAALTGDWADAERHLVAALRQLTAMRARPWVALAQHALADAIDARGRSSDREWVTALRAEAQWLASDLGLRPLAPMAARAV